MESGIKEQSARRYKMNQMECQWELHWNDSKHRNAQSFRKFWIWCRIGHSKWNDITSKHRGPWEQIREVMKSEDLGNIRKLFFFSIHFWSSRSASKCPISVLWHNVFYIFEYHKEQYSGNEKDIKISILECDSSLKFKCDRSLQQLLVSVRIELEFERIRLMDGLVTRSFICIGVPFHYISETMCSHANWFNTRSYKNFLAKEDLKWRQRILTTMRHITYQSVR